MLSKQTIELLEKYGIDYSQLDEEEIAIAKQAAEALEKEQADD